jgi:hypothetical protein
MAVKWMVVVLVAAAGCGSGDGIDPDVDKLGRATGPVVPQVGAPSAPRAPGGGMPGASAGADEPVISHRGEIAETMQVSNYTYMLLQTGEGQRVWTAIPRTDVQVGQIVQVAQSLVMRDFKSPTLNRTFETIVFGTLVGGAVPSSAPAMDGGLPPGHPPIAGDPAPAPAAGPQLPSGHPPVDKQPQ